jgi:arsenical pump membrane protein
VLAELARRENVFGWLAGLALRAASGSRARLFTLIYLVGIAVTTVLSNDATAVVLTPAVYAVMKRAKGNPLPYVFACALIANAASFVLPISNPANLVTFDNHLPPLVTWLRIFSRPVLRLSRLTSLCDFSSEERFKERSLPVSSSFDFPAPASLRCSASS